MKKMILDASGDTILYKNLGMTLMSPDIEVINHIMNVCDNLQFNYDIIDPSNSNSVGLNPFVYDDPAKIAITISSALKAMHNITHDDVEETYREDIVIQALENLTILLKEIYPKMHEGSLPNMEDMLKMFTNFELIEKMCEILAHDDDLKEKYSVQLSYFRKNFYKNSPGKEEIEKYLYSLVSQMDNLLRIPGVKNILCSRTNNIDFDKALENGNIIFMCTRRGDLGASSHIAFGLFFLISMQNAIFRRPGNEKTRVPHFLYIDEFPDFICKDTEAMFTMYRKYKIATTVSSQTLSQLEGSNKKRNYRTSILSNCANKIYTGGATTDELKWWSDEFGTRREWTWTNSIDAKTMEYDSKMNNINWQYVKYFKEGKLQGLGAKVCAFKVRDSGGRPMVGSAKFNYLEAKYKEPHKLKKYDFGKFSDNVTTETEDYDDPAGLRNKKFNLRDINFKDEYKDEFNPIQTDVTDSKYLFDNEDAIVVNLKKKNKKDKN